MKFHGHETLDGMRHSEFVAPQKRGSLSERGRLGRVFILIEETVNIISRGVESHQAGVQPSHVQTEPVGRGISVDVDHVAHATHSPKALLNSLLASVGHQYLQTMPAQTTPTVTEIDRC